MDNEFEAVKDKLPNVVINTTAANEHDGEIERKIRVVKEQVCAVTNTLPFVVIPKRILIEMISFAVVWMLFLSGMEYTTDFLHLNLFYVINLITKNTVKCLSDPTAKYMTSPLL